MTSQSSAQSIPFDTPSTSSSQSAALTSEQSASSALSSIATPQQSSSTSQQSSVTAQPSTSSSLPSPSSSEGSSCSEGFFLSLFSFSRKHREPLLHGRVFNKHIRQDGIAIRQDEIYHSAIVELLKVAGPRYLEGLNVFDGFGDYLSTDSTLHVNFKRERLTPDQPIALFRRESNPNSAVEVIEQINYNYICKFFKYDNP